MFIADISSSKQIKSFEVRILTFERSELSSSFLNCKGGRYPFSAPCERIKLKDR